MTDARKVSSGRKQICYFAFPAYPLLQYLKYHKVNLYPYINIQKYNEAKLNAIDIIKLLKYLLFKYLLNLYYPERFTELIALCESAKVFFNPFFNPAEIGKLGFMFF